MSYEQLNVGFTQICKYLKGIFIQNIAAEYL